MAEEVSVNPANDHHPTTVCHLDGDAASREFMEQLVSGMRLDYLGFRSGQTFLNTFDPRRPGCLVLEVRIPDVGGLQVQTYLRAQGSPLPVVFLTECSNHDTVVRAMQMGAFQFLRKPCEEQTLWETLQAAIQLDRQRRDRVAVQDLLRERLALLNAKEQDVLFLLAEHDSTQAIAAALNVSVRTVELRRARIISKLELRSPAELLRFVFRVTHELSQTNRDTAVLDFRPLTAKMYTPGVRSTRDENCGSAREKAE
jgi:FixJ family two-component response regulator